MNVASFFSGGKDSTYAILLAKKLGFDIKCLLTSFPKSPESHLLHHPNTKWTRLQAQAMHLPQLSVELDTTNTEEEVKSLGKLLDAAKKKFQIEGVVHGGITSSFQKTKFEKICKLKNLKCVSPLWGSDPIKYMNELINNKIEFIITAVSSEGLDDTWLGKTISHDNLNTLEILSKKFQFNINFDGGEAETFVVNCPLFEHPIKIIHGEKNWDGYRGRFEIVEAGVNYNA